MPKYLAEGLPKQNVAALSDACEYLDELIEWKQWPVENDDLSQATEPIGDESDGREETVVMEKVTCGDETCKCMTEGQKHGLYKCRYYHTSDGTLTSEYIDNE